MHAEFRPIVLGYALFVIIQFLTGAGTYWLKAGPTAADAYEYHRGSEAALKRFPDRPDRFLPEKTAAGVLKTQAPHTIAFAALFFILVHLIRSLGVNPRQIRIASSLFLFLCILDFTLPFLLLLDFEFLFALRFPVVLLFCGGGTALTLFLCMRMR
jgi:hypothetical protein